MAISTADLAGLPPPVRLRDLMQTLATLDAIVSPEWEYRYYSFNARWGDGELMGSMRNGSGDELFVLFNAAGAFIKGFDHERWPPSARAQDVYDRVPAAFRSGVDEPAFSPDHVTFCCWRTFQDDQWSAAGARPPEAGGDGSDWMLAGLDGDPATYLTFASAYYEVGLDAGRVDAVYRRTPMTLELARGLNPEIDFPWLLGELDEIGYPAAP